MKKKCNNCRHAFYNTLRGELRCYKEINHPTKTTKEGCCDDHKYIFNTFENILFALLIVSALIMLVRTLWL